MSPSSDNLDEATSASAPGDLGNLPAWYPLANAPWAEIERWIDADHRPYPAMEAALPWLKSKQELDHWVEGLRDSRTMNGAEWLCTAFPAVEAIPLPPRRIQEERA